MTENKWADRRRELEEKRARERGETVTSDEPAIPEQDLLPDFDGRERDGLDDRLDAMDIVEVYRRWCGKMVPKVAPGQTENIMISCPWHRDEVPSAWISTVEQAYECGSGKCGIGGGKYTIAAKHFGFEPKPTGADFLELREKMAKDLGLLPYEGINGTTWYQEEDEAPPVSKSDKPAETRKSPAKKKRGKSDQLEESTSKKTDDNVVQLETSTDIIAPRVQYPDLPWRDMVAEGTFLREYMEAVCNDDAPEAYHFWHGILALAHAAGRNVVLNDTPVVHGNLFICLLGETGVGKSRSKYWLDEVIRDVMPFKNTGLDCSGVRLIRTPASGEHLIDRFVFSVRDPTDPKKVMAIQPVNGLVDFNEFAAFADRAGRTGNSLRTTLMQFLDCPPEVGTGSRGSGEVLAKEPFCSVITTTQPKAIRELVTNRDATSGFLNRWIFAGARPKDQEVLGGVRSKIQVELDPAKDELQKVYSWCGKKRQIFLTDEAYAMMNKYWAERVKPTKAKDDTHLLQRIDFIFKKVILLFCINERKKEADVSVIHRVMKIFKYIIECYNILNENMGLTVTSEIEADIKYQIRKISGEEEPRGLKSKVQAKVKCDKALKSKHYEYDKIILMLKHMQQLGIIELEPRPRGPGAPTERFRMAAGE